MSVKNTVRCEQVEPLIAAMAISPLDDADARRVEDHLAGCPTCIAVAIAAMTEKEETVMHRGVVELPRSRRPRAVFVAAVVGAVAAALAIALVPRVLEESSRPPGAGRSAPPDDGVRAAPPKSDWAPPIPGQPEWSAGFQSPDPVMMSGCVVRAAVVSCVGRSSYVARQPDGEADAFAAAIEAYMHHAAMSSPSPEVAIEMARTVVARDVLLSAGNAERKSTVATAAALGAPLPKQRTDWYWEEYLQPSGDGHEFVVWVRVDVSLAERDALAKFFETHPLPWHGLAEAVKNRDPVVRERWNRRMQGLERQTE